MPFYTIYIDFLRSPSFSLSLSLWLCSAVVLFAFCPVALPASSPVIVTVCFRQGFVILCCQVEHAHWQLPTVCRLQLDSSSLEFREPGSRVRLDAWLECVSRQWVTPQFPAPIPSSFPFPLTFPFPSLIPIQSTGLSAIGRSANYTFWRRAQCVRRLGVKAGQGAFTLSWLSFGLLLTNNDTAICRFRSTPRSKYLPLEPTSRVNKVNSNFV